MSSLTTAIERLGQEKPDCKEPASICSTSESCSAEAAARRREMRGMLTMSRMASAKPASALEMRMPSKGLPVSRVSSTASATLPPQQAEHNPVGGPVVDPGQVQPRRCKPLLRSGRRAVAPPS